MMCFHPYQSLVNKEMDCFHLWKPEATEVLSYWVSFLVKHEHIRTNHRPGIEVVTLQSPPYLLHMCLLFYYR